MANPDSSCLPLVEVELDQIQALLSPVLKGAAIAGVERVEGGLTNTLYRITPADGGVSLCLRIFAAGRLPWERELKILARVSASLPVPAPVYTENSVLGKKRLFSADFHGAKSINISR